MKRAKPTWVRFKYDQVAAALYVATGGLIDLAAACRACQVNGNWDGCPLCRGTGKIAS